MTTEQFAYWLQGFAEINGAPPSPEQWEVIKEHLQLCFLKVTSNKGAPHDPTDLPEWMKRIKQSPSVPLQWLQPPTITC